MLNTPKDIERSDNYRKYPLTFMPFRVIYVAPKIKEEVI